MSTPSLMVLYTSDAVEVRYSDGSCSQLSPCGTSVLHHDRRQPGNHPLAGLKQIQQRCRFVTSEYKSKVLQALDFRNRFAERPYLCQDLLIKDDVVSMYADIKEVAWPKTVDKARAEFLPDGSVRIFSSDEFASLSLSQHRRDFTVCYLSKISQEPVKNKSLVSSRKSVAVQQTSASHNRTSALHNRTGESECDEIRRLVPSGDCPASSGTKDDSSDSINQNKRVVVSAGNSGDTSEACRVDPLYTRISTPTNFGDGGALEGEAVVMPFGRNAVFRRYGGGSNEVSPAAHEISSISKTSSEGLCTTLDIDITVGHHEASLEHRSASPVLPGQNTSGSRETDSKSNSTGHSSRSDSSIRRIATVNSSQESEKSVQFADDSGCSSACQFLYTWVTRHISCNECPTRWSHALKLAEEKCNDRQSDENNQDIIADIPPSKMNIPVKINRKLSVMSPLPLPLPLTCPTQHRHKWAPVDPDTEGDRFNTARLKVIMVDGMIYRLIHLPTLKVMEVYPGDGSVFISQGVTGQFFTQIMPIGDKLEERTYSVRTLPPPLTSAKYPLEKMLKRACRFLSEAAQRDKLTHSEEQPCWKIEALPVLEPLSVSILEEVYIPAVGRFTAHTNGRVRVVFDDRTSLDMVCDFSRRIEECAHHSSAELDDSLQGVHTSMAKVTALDSEIDSDTCRLLLPSGKYILVNKLKPGTYHRYVSQALEWSSWVNASPLERKQFYERLGQTVTAQGSAALELQKINCFNYILENTVLHSNPVGQSGRPVSQKHGLHPTPPSIQGLDASNQFCPIKDFHPQHRSQPMTGQLASSSWHSDIHQGPLRGSVGQMSWCPQPISSSVLSSNQVPGSRPLYPSSHVPAWESSKGRTMEMLEGFNSVRHALLQTHKLIHDIDDMLDKKS